MSNEAASAPKVGQDKRSRSLEIAGAGITTANQFANLMSALMSEALSGEIAPSVCNAVVNAGGKLLKVVEMQHRYGKPTSQNDKELVLCSPPEQDENRERIGRLEEELQQLKARNGYADPAVLMRR